MFLECINYLNQHYNISEGNNSSTERCVEQISHYEWYQFALIPAVLFTLSMAVTKRRRNLFLHIWSGRPGLIYPMDTLTRTSRISYACSFGATAFLVYEIVMGRKNAIRYTGDNQAVNSFVRIGSMFIYGMVFFPLFASLAVGSVYGYLLGTLYIWMLTIMEAYRVFQCPMSHEEVGVLLFFRGLPNFLCLLYLSVSLPIRMVLAWRRGHYFRWKEDRQMINTLQDIRDSYVGHYVTQLFRKPKVKLPLETKYGRTTGTVLSLAHRFIYKRKSGFRYPARVLSVLFTAAIIIYMASFDLLRLTRIFDDIEQNHGTESAPNLDVVSCRLLLIEFLEAIKACFIVSVVFAALFAAFTILHTLSSYRANIIALYRGDHSHIPPVSAFRNINHCVSSIKYGGFQVAYTVSGYITQVVILFLVTFTLATIIILLKNDISAWFLKLLNFFWPYLLMLVIIWIAQLLLAKLVFLQERGALLTLNNRNVYFTFTYFMFFYNMFLGLVSCLVRILKAMAVGVVFVSRLDSSILPRRFEFMDPGFRAYVGYMHMEAAHSHPVLVAFCRLMLLTLSDKRDREAGRTMKNSSNSSQEESRHRPSRVSQIAVDVSDRIELVISRVRRTGNASNNYNGPLTTSSTSPTSTTTTTSTNEVELDNNGDDNGEQEERRRRRRVAARFHWHVTYTLLHNPDIRVMRRRYLHLLRQARAMGVYIPVSDRQADVDLDQLQGLVAQARGANRSNPFWSRKRREGEDDEEGGGGGGRDDTGDAAAATQTTQQQAVTRRTGASQGKTATPFSPAAAPTTASSAHEDGVSLEDVFTVV